MKCFICKENLESNKRKIILEAFFLPQVLYFCPEHYLLFAEIMKHKSKNITEESFNGFYDELVDYREEYKKMLKMDDIKDTIEDDFRKTIAYVVSQPLELTLTHQVICEKTHESVSGRYCIECTQECRDFEIKISPIKSGP